MRGDDCKDRCPRKCVTIASLGVRPEARAWGSLRFGGAVWRRVSAGAGLLVVREMFLLFPSQHCDGQKVALREGHIVQTGIAADVLCTWALLCSSMSADGGSCFWLDMR